MVNVVYTQVYFTPIYWAYEVRWLAEVVECALQVCVRAPGSKGVSQGCLAHVYMATLEEEQTTCRKGSSCNLYCSTNAIHTNKPTDYTAESQNAGHPQQFLHEHIWVFLHSSSWPHPYGSRFAADLPHDVPHATP